MTRVAAALAFALFASGCTAALPAVQGWHSTLRGRIHDVKSMGAMVCAPGELARAQMAYRFATQEILAGDLSRATSHLDEGMDAADRAEQAGKVCGVRGPRVTDRDRDPWIDQDGDGVLEPDDECPQVLEDFDGFRDHDGCPEPDNDLDGLPDSMDPCPDAAEDFDEFQDEDGCPELDNDADGVNDDVDQCPSEPETLNAFEDEDGCPDFAPQLLTVDGDRLRLKRKLDFAPGMNILLGTAHPALREVAEVLRLSGDKVLRIEGHTDNRGEPDVLKGVSEQRAAQVRDFLLTQGVPADRMQIEGLGDTNPVSTNRTSAGRKANDRIELILLDPAKE